MIPIYDQPNGININNGCGSTHLEALQKKVVEVGADCGIANDGDAGKILLLLIQNPGRVFPAEEIYERVWNERAVNTDTVMVHIRNLREKIEVNPREPKYVKVVWGVGYKIEKQP